MLKKMAHRISLAAAFGIAAISLQACGGGGGTTASVAVPSPTGVSSVIAFSQTLSTTKNNPITITLQGESPAAGTLTFDVYTSPASGTLTGQLAGINPVMTYTPGLDYYGNDAFTFHVTDTQGNTGTGTINIQVLNSISPLADSDGDGLLDLNELNTFGTNPQLADTDGDGFDDFSEVVTFAFDNQVNNFRFNPLIADMPEIDIQLVSQPEIQLNYTTTSGSSQSISTNRSVSSSTSTSHSKAYTSTWSSSVSHEAGVSLTLGNQTEGGSKGFNAKVSVSATASYTNTNTEGHEKSTSWNDETTHENGTTNDKGTAFEENNSISTSDGDILVSVKVANTGNVAYSINNLFLNASYFDGSAADRPFVPVGTLKFDDPNNSQFPVFTLSPGQATGVMTFRTSPLNVNAVKKLLRDSRGMSIRPSIYDMLDQNGTSYNFASTGIGTQTALVKVDYVGNGGRKNITKRVAVHGDPSAAVTVDHILNGILQINAVVTDSYGAPASQGVVSSVDGLTNNDPYGFWIMMLGKNQGNNQMETTTYTTPQDRSRWIARGNLDPYTTSIVDQYDPTQLTVNGGDIVHLFYMQDSDLDGLPDVQEFFYRSDPLQKDTDGDGLEDSTEVKGWDVTWENQFHSQPTQHVYSSPTLKDTDSDGVTDDLEANLTDPYSINRRNPRLADTDGDSIVDGVDDKMGAGLGPNVFQNLGMSDLYTTVTLNQLVSPYSSVTVSYALPTSLYQMPANGYSSYAVAMYRLVDANATFPDPAYPPQNGISPILGDTLPCQAPATCQWTAVNVYQTFNGATNQPMVPVANEQFTETGLLVANTSAKYIAYVSVDGKWKANPTSVLATSDSEIVRFTMHPALISGVKSLVGPAHHADTSGTNRGAHDSSNPQWYYWNWNRTVYHFSSGGADLWSFSSANPVCYFCGGYDRTANAYQRYDLGFGVTPDTAHRGNDLRILYNGNPSQAFYAQDINGTVIDDLPADYWEAPINYPYNKGDGEVNLRWYLQVDGMSLYDSGVKTIDNTYHADLAATTVSPFIDQQPLSGGVPVYSGAPSVFVNTTDPYSSYPAKGVFEIELPAVPQCYLIDLGEYEIDLKVPGGINPIANGDAVAVADLCRDNSPAGFGVWTLTDRTSGAVLGSTRKGNINSIPFYGHVFWREKPPADQSVPWKYRTDWHAVSTSFDLFMGYDLSVR